MSPRKKLLRFAMLGMLIATGACTHSGGMDLAPNPLRALTIPAAGETAAAVVARNGEPERREQADGTELWVYHRLHPEGTGLRSRSALVRLRDGVVIDARETVGGLWTPTPTVPAGI